jgi:hypothetical protein
VSRQPTFGRGSVDYPLLACEIAQDRKEPVFTQFSLAPRRLGEGRPAGTAQLTGINDHSTVPAQPAALPVNEAWRSSILRPLLSLPEDRNILLTCLEAMAKPTSSGEAFAAEPKIVAPKPIGNRSAVPSAHGCGARAWTTVRRIDRSSPDPAPRCCTWGSGKCSSSPTRWCFLAMRCANGGKL